MQGPDELPLVPRQPQRCSKHAKAAVQVPDNLIRPQTTSELFLTCCRQQLYLFTCLATFLLIPRNLRVVLNMLEQLYRDLATFLLFLPFLRAVLNMSQQVYRYLATFLLFPSNLRADLNMLQQLYRYLAIFPCSQTTPELLITCCNAAAAKQTPKSSSYSQRTSELF